MPIYVPRLDPCKSDHAGFKDRKRYKELGLPDAWIADRIKGHGWFAPDEYFWTPDEFFTVDDEMPLDLLREIRACTGGCFYDLTLSQQCQLLGVKLDVVTVAELAGGEVSTEGVGKRGGTAIELFALQCFQSQGWEGDRCEGASFFLISHAVREFVEKANVAYHPHEWTERRKPRVRNSLSPKEFEVLDEAISRLDEQLLNKWLECAIATPHKAVVPKGPAFGLTISQVASCWKALGAKEIRRFCELQMLGFGGMGWPDLTLHRESEVKFVEVKQGKDKFTHRQTYWFRNFGRPMGWDITVLNVIPIKNK